MENEREDQVAGISALYIKLDFRGPCGFAGGGKLAYLVNTHPSLRLRVTYDVIATQGGSTTLRTRKTIELDPKDREGSEESLGCSRTSSIPFTSFSWEKVLVEEV